MISQCESCKYSKLPYTTEPCRSCILARGKWSGYVPKGEEMLSCYQEQDHDGCKGCENEEKNGNEYPCAICKTNIDYKDWYKPKKDMVEVIRCGECINYVRTSGLCRIWSKFGTITTAPEGFCYKGEI